MLAALTPSSLRACRRTGLRLLCSTLDRPIVQVHHPDPKVLRDIVSASRPDEMLRIFEREGDQFGWLTAKEMINRVAKAESKRPSGFDASDERFERLLAIPTLALEQV